MLVEVEVLDGLGGGGGGFVAQFGYLLLEIYVCFVLHDLVAL